MTKATLWYRAAGEMLLEAKEQVSYGSWGRWLSKNFELAQCTARTYMRLAREDQKRMAHAEVNGSSGETSPGSLSEMSGNTARAQQRRDTARPLFEAVRNLDRDIYAQEKQARDWPGRWSSDGSTFRRCLRNDSTFGF
jgi:hypothetical protein